MTTLPQLFHNLAMNLASFEIKNMNPNLPFDYLLINKFIFIINITRKGKNETLYPTFRGHSVTPPKSGKVVKLQKNGVDGVIFT